MTPISLAALRRQLQRRVGPQDAQAMGENAAGNHAAVPQSSGAGHSDCFQMAYLPQSTALLQKRRAVAIHGRIVDHPTEMRSTVGYPCCW
jgi:hypothetical protein